jgi:pimeloyl-ACP methyl ester carboxylesterase
LNAYFLSGLGADRRVFEKIHLPEGINCIHLDWIPIKKNESVPEYAKRISEPINSSAPFILIGLSFGGMLATEIAKIKKPLLTVLISTVPVSSHLPFYFKLAGWLGFDRMLPLKTLRNPPLPVVYWLNNVKSKEAKTFVAALLKDSDKQLFSKLAMGAILRWKNTIKPEGVYHLHGSADRILPVAFTKPDYIVKGAGHLMVYTHPEIISQRMSEVISYIWKKDN